VFDQEKCTLFIGTYISKINFQKLVKNKQLNLFYNIVIAALSLLAVGLLITESFVPIYHKQLGMIDDGIIIINEKEIEDKIKSKEIITTENELKSFEYIKEMLANYGRNVDQLGYKNTLNYFSIYVSNLNNWFIRINVDSNSNNFVTISCGVRLYWDPWK